MGKVIKFQQNLDYYLKILDAKLLEKDYLGALNTVRSACDYAKTRIDKNAFNLLLGEIYFEMQLYDLSCDYFFRALDTPETRAGAYFGVGRNLIFLDKHTLALEYFDTSILTSGVDEYVAGIYEWTNYIKNDLNSKKYEKNTLKIAKNLIKLQKYDKSLEILQDKIASGDSEAIVLEAEIFILKGEYNRARELIFGVLNTKETVEGLIALAVLCINENDYSSLEMVLEKIDNFDLKKAQLNTVAEMYSILGKYEKSIEKYLKITEIDAFNVKNLLFLAISYYNLGDIQEALYYVGRARWIDIENPVLNIYYDIFNRKRIDAPLKVAYKVPYTIAEEKIDLIYKNLNSVDFKISFTQGVILDDFEWAYTIQNHNLTEDITKVLSTLRQKEAKKLYKRLLLSTRLNSDQKFLLTKYALLNRNLKTINVTQNYNYISFKNKLHIDSDAIIQKGLCSAVAFAKINNIDAKFDGIRHKICRVSWNSCVDVYVDENLFACLFLSENQSNMERASIYFDVDKTNLCRALKELYNC